MSNFRRIIISRTDSIGDVVLTLPVAGIIKRKFPGAFIIFLGRSYTRDVVSACGHIDKFLDWDLLSTMDEETAALSLNKQEADLIIHVFPRREIASLAKKARIPVRLGTTNRLYHWFTCNRLVRLSRRRSGLHEAQLNLKLIERITGMKDIAFDAIPGLYGLSRTEPLHPGFNTLIDPDRFNLIIHPKSKGSAREWGIGNFRELARMLPREKYKVFLSGTHEEGLLMQGSGLIEDDGITDLTGKMSLGQFMAFIRACDGLVAASTGPLHLAAALGIRAVGIYPPIRPMHPGRWAPCGHSATYAVLEKECNDCRNNSNCHCMQEISPAIIKNLIEGNMK